MESEWIDKGDRMIVKLSGSLDGTSASSFGQEVEGKINDLGSELVWDFSKIEYVSSAGLRVILKTSMLMKGKDKIFILCNLQKYVHEVFDMAGLCRILDIRENCEEL